MITRLLCFSAFLYIKSTKLTTSRPIRKKSAHNSSNLVLNSFQLFISQLKLCSADDDDYAATIKKTYAFDFERWHTLTFIILYTNTEDRTDTKPHDDRKENEIKKKEKKIKCNPKYVVKKKRENHAHTGNSFFFFFLFFFFISA